MQDFAQIDRQKFLASRKARAHWYDVLGAGAVGALLAVGMILALT